MTKLIRRRASLEQNGHRDVPLRGFVHLFRKNELHGVHELIVPGTSSRASFMGIRILHTLKEISYGPDLPLAI